MGKIGVRKALAVLLCALMLLPLAGALSAQAEQSAEKESPKASKESAQDKAAGQDDKDAEDPLPLLPREKSGSADKGDDAVLEEGVTATGSLEAPAKGSSAPRSADSLNIAQSPANGTLSSGSSALSRGMFPEEAAAPRSSSGAVEVIVGAQSESSPVAGTLSQPPGANTKQNTMSEKPGSAAGKPAAAKTGSKTPGTTVARPGAGNWPPAAPKKNAADSAAPIAAKPAGKPASAAVKPAAKQPAPAEPAAEALLNEQSIADYFAESANESGESAGLLESLEAEAQPTSGVIPADIGGEAGAGGTIGGLLDGNSSTAVGGSVPRVSPARSIAIVLACLGLVALGGWVSKKKLSGGGFSAASFPFAQARQKAMSIVESVSLGQGRQISIVAIKDEALVLGITPQNVTLLDKFPLARLSEDYRGTMEQLIEREDEAADEASQWRRLRQRQQGEQQPPLEQRRAVGDFAPAPQRSLGESRTISIEDLRRQRGSNSSNGSNSTRRLGSVAQARGVYGDQASRDGLISRIREHLDKLEG